MAKLAPAGNGDVPSSSVLGGLSGRPSACAETTTHTHTDTHVHGEYTETTTHFLCFAHVQDWA